MTFSVNSGLAVNIELEATRCSAYPLQQTKRTRQMP